MDRSITYSICLDVVEISVICRSVYILYISTEDNNNFAISKTVMNIDWGIILGFHSTSHENEIVNRVLTTKFTKAVKLMASHLIKSELSFN